MSLDISAVLESRVNTSLSLENYSRFYCRFSVVYID